MYKQTPLHIAVEIKDLALIQILVENGADGYIKNIDGNSPIDIAIAERSQELVNYFRSINRFSSYFD